MSVFLTLLFASATTAGKVDVVAATGSPTTPASAEVCGSCHRAIHGAWQRSGHARAMESRTFQDALETADEGGGLAARRLCLGCHAPVAAATGDLQLHNKVSWEGVTCDYCHSVRDVSFSGPIAKARTEFGAAKGGTLKNAASPAHQTVFSSVHKTSATCASCHDYRNAQGLPVMMTYTEWKDGPAAKEGKQCQSCHMFLVKGDVVEPRVRRGGSVNLHETPGSHSLEQLNKAIRATLTAQRESGQLRVSVDVINRTGGHYIPTGSPLRQVVLELETDTFDGRRFREERRYKRTLGDQQGAPLPNEYLTITKAAKVISDTRLLPGEKRTETFLFPVAPNVRAHVKAKFWYYYNPSARKDSENRVTFLELSRLVQ